MTSLVRMCRTHFSRLCILTIEIRFMIRPLVMIATLLTAIVASGAAAPGWPTREANLDALPGFQNPPAGYGEVPFWWWTGEDLNVDRLLWQLRELHKKGISGVQVNYSHLDTPGWSTDVQEPAIFSDDWWQVYSRVSEECAKLDMGIGLSTYTLDWPHGGQNLFLELFYSKPELNALELDLGLRKRLKAGEALALPVLAEQVAVRAYEVIDGLLQRGGVDLSPHVQDGELAWTAPAGEWEVWQFVQTRKAGSLNPLLPESGATVIRDFFQPFENHNPGGGSDGLNYFFNDELHIGADKFAWNADFAAEFRERKGYELFDVLPAMWSDIGDITPKVRIDYADVRMSLMEERYFKPIYDWHASRGIIFGCDSGGRGTKPHEFGDYFRATRWYTAPGHDTPGGNADLIKGKVSSSVANLYQQPRVWLEGYHSMGWGATPEQLMFATRENYLYGCTLLNLHGLYYTTYGSYWEWAPPCYHFHMPYWEHMREFLGYFDRLSYLMSQGHHVCDVAVVYPVVPYEAETNGDAAKDTAFELGKQLMAAGINFDYIDHDSLARAVVRDGRLVVKDAKASYQALIFPNMDAARWKSVQKAAEFAEAAGHVMVVGALPLASDRSGRNDTELVELNERAFVPGYRFEQSDAVIDALRKAFVPDVYGVDQVVRALHRKVGFRDVYMVMDAQPGKLVEFRATGAVELWDPWTGEATPLRVHEATATGTLVQLPLQPHEAQVVVFTPGKVHENPPAQTESIVEETLLPGPWTVSFEPTMNNQFGDFRLPVTESNQMIGVEARRFQWSPDTVGMKPTSDDRVWMDQMHGFGPKFYQLGPIPESVDSSALDAALAKLIQVDPSVPVQIDGQDFHWQPYSFSWRYGHTDDPGHQGFHGLKGHISEDFIRLGTITGGPHGTKLIAPEAHQRYYLWTAAIADEALAASVFTSQQAPAVRNGSPVVTPAAIYVNGQRVEGTAPTVALNAGANPLLIRFDNFGQGHVVLRREKSPTFEQTESLAMPWYQDPAVIPYDVSSAEGGAEWFRFVSAPGTTAIHLNATSREQPQVWCNGKPMRAAGDGHYEVQGTVNSTAVITIRLLPEAGHTGGAAIPEPVMIETSGNGVMPLGDWSKMGVLNNYSGGVRYQTAFELPESDADLVMLDLGKVSATAEVIVNGQSAGIRVAPPWSFDVSDRLRVGENQIEVLVYNTLSNHYQTIPSSYRGDPESGLFGPVRVIRSVQK
jgi:hypothetical protein